jgi:hypothetical protein
MRFITLTLSTLLMTSCSGGFGMHYQAELGAYGELHEPAPQPYDPYAI